MAATFTITDEVCPAWRATCKALGITHTSKAITASVRGEDA